MSINRVNIAGNLTKDPEVSQTNSGTAVASFCVAINERHKNKQTDEWEDCPVFVDCTAFGWKAETVGKYLGKGDKVAIEGKLRLKRWEAKDGTSRSKLDVLVDVVEFMSGKTTGANHQPAPGNGSYQPSYAAPAPAQPELYDQDIPF